MLIPVFTVTEIELYFTLLYFTLLKFYNFLEGCHARRLWPKGQSLTHINDDAQHPCLKPRKEKTPCFK